MDNQGRIDVLRNICSSITGCKGFEFLVKNQKPAVVIVLFMLEAISVALDQLGKSKSNCLLAALLLSAFTFLITVFPHVVKGGTSARIKSKAERQLLVVEIVFSVVQLITSFAHYIMKILGVKNNYSTLIFPLAFATIAIAFLFLKDEEVSDSSHDQIHNISSPGGPHSINISFPTDISDPNDENQQVNFGSRPRQRNQSKNIEVHMLDTGALTSIDLSKFSGYGDLYKKLAEIFNTEEELLASESFYIDELLNTEALEKKPWDDLCLVASKIIIIYQKQKQVFNNEQIVRNEDLSRESEESNEYFNFQNMLNEEGRECEEDFDSQNRVNEEGKNKQLSLRVLATAISSTLRRASKISEMFGHASSPVISCIIINTNDIFLLVVESLHIIMAVLVGVLLLLRLDYHASLDSLLFTAKASMQSSNPK